VLASLSANFYHDSTVLRWISDLRGSQRGCTLAGPRFEPAWFRQKSALSQGIEVGRPEQDIIILLSEKGRTSSTLMPPGTAKDFR
jgi:hypothetical protein